MAPRDNPLPKPWERLVDDSGYYFYWNAETDVTQYERPTCPPPRNFAQVSCTIEFDGASRGNPGKAGAGAVLRSSRDNRVLFCLRQGLGIATNNVAEYRALILGLEYALDKGFRNVRVQGDSMLVCMQVQDAWRVNNPKLAELCEYAKELMSQFNSCSIQHVGREFNSEADAQANRAINLGDGQSQCDSRG